MGKPWALRLLRSCLFFSGRKRTKETIQQVNLGGEDDIIDDGDGVSVSLPEDIIFDVLARLPVKALCRFRCVSKGWRALISDPAFAAAQQSRAAASAPIVVGVFGKPRRWTKFYPPRPPLYPEESVELRVIDTADGTVLRVVKDVKSTKLMRTRLDLVFVDQGEHGARVIDPATGQVLKFNRELPDRYPTANYNRTSNIFNIYSRSCHCSFGRATSSGTYKVLRLYDTVLWNGDVIQICQVATLCDGMAAEPMWRQRPEPPILTCHCSNCTAVVDGVLHFMDRGRRPADTTTHGRRPGSPGWNRIASFDLESEEWKMVIDGPVTECPKEEKWDMVLAEFKGNLSVVQTVAFYNCRDREPYTNIWLLVDPEKSIWVKKHTIHMPKSCCHFKALAILGDGRVLTLNNFEKDDDDEAFLDSQCILQFYNPSTGALTDVMEMGVDFRGSMTIYTGSLL
ncbi:hypothetical protein SETIT_1G226600v2 [Setaria italica]|uniref:F-box domain-containing protein n=1 Tax=Setaria italica TaxID=4555 RepID=K3YYG0_SETIT|nr:hypothetical protein SETIT_1G226600v2 [Setaria italica]